MAAETSSQGSPVRGSRIDGPPPLPPKLSNPSTPKQSDLAATSGAPQGTPPTGQLAQTVLEHAQLAEQILVSLSRMLPSFTPVAAQMQASLRLGVVKALKDATQSPQQSLAQGAGPSIPPGAQPSQGAPSGAMPPPPGAGAPPAAGVGPQ